MAYRGGFSFGYGMTPWVLRLILINVAVFLLSWLVMPQLTMMLAFVPAQILTRPWTLVTYMFAHGGVGHIFFNMLGLFFFGPPLEARWGAKEFLRFYFICGVGGALLSFAFAPHSPIIGASAAIFGVMLAFAMNWPDVPIYIWGIFPIKAKWLVMIMAAITFYSAFSGSGGNIAHFAHLGGFVAGFLYLKFDPSRSATLASFRKLFTRNRMTVVSGGGRDAQDARATPQRPAPAQRPVDSKLLDELDRVLDKISTQGMGSLTAEERRLLDDASRRYKQN